VIALTPVWALTSAGITIDGSFTDWDGVLADPDNVANDTILPDDPDVVGQADRDLDQVAATWDSTYLYLYWRRTASGSRQVVQYAFIDCDGDGLLQSTDKVGIFGFNNKGWQSGPNDSNVVYYSPVDSGGDSMGGDGVTPVGSADTKTNRVPGASYSAARSSYGIRFEARISWASLGVSAGSPINLHFADGNGTQTPLHIEDNVGPLVSFLDRDVTLEPDRYAGASADTTVTYTFTLTNSGNASDVFDLTTSSSQSWTTGISVDGSAVTTVALGANESTTVVVSVRVPSSAADGTEDVTTLRARSQSDTDVTDTVTATTVVGDVVVLPDQTGSMAPSGTIEYVHTISNNTTGTLALDLDSSSTQGWSTEVYDAAGVSSLSSISLASGETTTVVVRVTVPAGTSVGTQDVTTLTATDQSDSSVSDSAQDGTTVRDAIAITPDNESVGGPGTTVSYLHTVTNSWSETRTISLSASSSEGWTTVIFEDDGVTSTSSVTLGPNGDSADIWVRVTIPSSATSSDEDTTTVTASYFGASDTATDHTTVSSLATYADPGYTDYSTSYMLGDTVYAKGAGLGSYSDVKFRWIDADSTVVFTSSAIPVDVLDQAMSSYSLGTTATVGEWTLVLLDASDDSEITRSYFDVGYDAEITSLSASDAPSIGDVVLVDADLENGGASAITSSTLTYTIWWDSDGDGVFDAGDLYMDESGTSQTYSGSGSVVSHETTGIAVAASGGTWSETTWAMSNTGFPNQGTYKITATWTSSTGDLIDVKTSEFYSIPALGWPLAIVAAVVGAAFMWRRRDRLGIPNLVGAVTP
jgi:hypothetical protein